MFLIFFFILSHPFQIFFNKNIRIIKTLEILKSQRSCVQKHLQDLFFWAWVAVFVFIYWATVTNIANSGFKKTNKPNLLFYSSGGQKSEIKVLAGLIPSQDLRAGSVPGLSLGFW